MSDYTLVTGDCREEMPAMQAESVDAMVTDPPAGIAFMGEDWDDDRGGRDAWVDWMTETFREAHRVLKPGAHALVWALPRTSHWTAWALESAGFEIRDRVAHLFGTGFPKSLDVSKAIDRAAGAEREVVGQSTTFRPNTRKRGTEGMRDRRTSGEITAPATDDARRWDGWGTALKPACEDWWLVRKPLAEGTVAANVLEHGIGALNVDGCRIGTTKDVPASRGERNLADLNCGWGLKAKDGVPGMDPNIGRWPANVVLDEAAAERLDRETGALAGRGNAGPSEVTAEAKNQGRTMNKGWGPRDCGVASTHDDGGGPSRFFYCAKASRAEREAGLEGLSRVAAGNFDDDGHRKPGERKNDHTAPAPTLNPHPTVKPIALMRWLVRLVTPEGGTVLDPFCGSGTTGVACTLEGFDFIGIERDPQYVEIARRRIGNTQPSLFSSANRETGG